MSECQHHDYTMVENYIRGLQWSAEATDHEKSLVAGNIRGFYAHLLNTPTPATGSGGDDFTNHPALQVPCRFCGQVGMCQQPLKCIEASNASSEHPAPAGGGAGDSARLDFVIQNDAFFMRKLADSGAVTFQLVTQDEDENYIDLSGKHQFFATPRDAIDAAMALTAKPGAEGSP